MPQKIHICAKQNFTIQNIEQQCYYQMLHQRKNNTSKQMTPTTFDLATPVTCTGTETASRDCLSKRSYTFFNGQTQFPLGGLPTDAVELIFVRCLSNEDFKGFTALSLTNVHSYVTMRELINKVALTTLCPNLSILDVKTLEFCADLQSIERYKTLQSYYKLEPFIENRAGLTITFNYGGLTLMDLGRNGTGIHISCLGGIIDELGNLPEEDRGPEMISNSIIIGTSGENPEIQETRVRDEIGFDGKPTFMGYLLPKIGTQKKFGTCLYREKPYIHGRTSTHLSNLDVVAVGCTTVGDTDEGALCLSLSSSNEYGSGGRLKLELISL